MVDACGQACRSRFGKSDRSEFALARLSRPVPPTPSAIGGVTAPSRIPSRPSGWIHPQPEKALIGVRAIDGQQFLLSRLTTRKNLASGCILRRSYRCHLAVPGALKLRHAHGSWADVSRRIRPGHLLPQSVTHRNFNRTLKAVLARFRTPSAVRCRSHCPHRFASQELRPGLTGPRRRHLGYGARQPSGGAWTCSGARSWAFPSCPQSSSTPTQRAMGASA